MLITSIGELNNFIGQPIFLTNITKGDACITPWQPSMLVSNEQTSKILCLDAKAEYTDIFNKEFRFGFDVNKYIEDPNAAIASTARDIKDWLILQKLTMDPQAVYINTRFSSQHFYGEMILVNEIGNVWRQI